MFALCKINQCGLVLSYPLDCQLWTPFFNWLPALLFSTWLSYFNLFQETHTDGDPELLDDSEFYQQLLKEFFETVDPTSSGKK